MISSASLLLLILLYKVHRTNDLNVKRRKGVKVCIHRSTRAAAAAAAVACRHVMRSTYLRRVVERAEFYRESLISLLQQLVYVYNINYIYSYNQYFRVLLRGTIVNRTKYCE